MLFAFFHELGHLIAGIILGFKPKSLSITPVGLTVSFKIRTEDYNEKIKNGNILALKKLIIALAGPMVNFGIVSLMFLCNFNIFNIPRDLIIYSNLLVGVFNLIPIYPLDGGRVVNCVCHILCGLKKSYTYCNKISNITIIILTILSSILILYLKNVSLIIIIAYLWFLVINENKIYSQRRKLYKLIAKEENIKSNEQECSCNDIT